MKREIHIKRHGAPLCKFTSLPAHSWPPSHVSISISQIIEDAERHSMLFHGDLKDINEDPCGPNKPDDNYCLDCISVARKLYADFCSYEDVPGVEP